MNTEYPIIDNHAEGKKVEHIGEVLPDNRRSVFSKTLRVEAISLHASELGVSKASKTVGSAVLQRANSLAIRSVIHSSPELIPIQVRFLLWPYASSLSDTASSRRFVSELRGP